MEIITTGLHANRLKETELSQREIAFAKQWTDENERQSGYSAQLLEYLINNPSERDQIVAATIIQWLGTNVGMNFIGQVIESCPQVEQTLKIYFREKEGK